MLLHTISLYKLQGGMEMTNISELELQNLRHLIGGFDTTHCKMKEYASCA